MQEEIGLSKKNYKRPKPILTNSAEVLRKLGGPKLFQEFGLIAEWGTVGILEPLALSCLDLGNGSCKALRVKIRRPGES